MSGFHPKAWVAWLAASATVTLAIENPFASAIAFLALALVAATFRRPGPEGRAAAFFFKFGLAVVAVRVVLFGLTGHAGDTTLFTLPEIGLPAWLGGFALGGRITGEVVAQQVAEGIKIAAFIVSFGVFLASVETYRVLRMLPRFLFEAGLVAGIAITFVPSLLRSAAEVRDAQRMRGHRFRGLRSLRPLVLPMLAGALERSLSLASSMESRGFGYAAKDNAATDARAKASVLGGLLGLCAAGGLSLAGAAVPALLVLGAGAAAIALGLRSLSASLSRTRLREDRLDASDVALIAGSVMLAVLAVAARTLDAAHWYAYPVFRLPEADLRLVALAVAIAVPVPLSALRGFVLRAAESRHPMSDTVEANR